MLVFPTLFKVTTLALRRPSSPLRLVESLPVDLFVFSVAFSYSGGVRRECGIVVHAQRNYQEARFACGCLAFRAFSQKRTMRGSFVLIKKTCAPMGFDLLLQHGSLTDIRLRNESAPKASPRFQWFSSRF